QNSNSVPKTNTIKRMNELNFKSNKQPKKEILDEKEQKNKLFKLLRKINLDITKTKKEINIVNGQIARSRIKTLKSLSKRKYINEETIKEIEKESSTSDFTNDKRKTIKDKTNSTKVIYQNLKNASNRSTQVYIPDLLYNILYNIEENITKDGKPKSSKKILLDTIASKLYSDASFKNDYSSFSTEVIEMSLKKFNGTKVKFGKTVYTDENIVTNSLIALNRFGQKISDNLSKAFKLRLHGFFTQIDMSIILNAGKEGVMIDPDNDRNIYEPPKDPNMKETEDNFAFMRDNLELSDIFKKGTTRFNNTDDNMRSQINQDNWKFMLA
ncbi:2590_t:CDS:2, partial [Scutellospora calospora]